MAAAGISFWGVRCKDPLHYRLCILAREKARMQQTIAGAGCTAELLEERGLPLLLCRLRRRPVFVLSFFMAVAATFFLQSLVWTVQVEGNKTIPAEAILQALEEEGVSVGTWTYGADMLRVRLRLCNRLPGLAWVAINRTGGKLTVFVAEREQVPDETAPYAVGHIVAARSGVITDYAIMEGMKLCDRGDVVREGQVLVSGNEDYGLFLRRVCAAGEIYADTWHTGTVAMPVERMKKCYTGRVWERVSLIVGRKRINFSGNSSNLPITCDKIKKVKQVKLPGYVFPIRIEREIYREYSPEPTDVSPHAAEQLLQGAWRQSLKQTMVAGQIKETSTTFRRSGGLYLLQAESTCNEMIGRLISGEKPSEGEQNE